MFESPSSTQTNGSTIHETPNKAKFRHGFLVFMAEMKGFFSNLCCLLT